MSVRKNLNDEEKVLLEDEGIDAVKVYSRIPYALINSELTVGAQNVIQEFGEICRYYKIYKKGKLFTVEGANGDYIPAKLKYKMAASLVNKEARFLFAEEPDIKIEPKGDVGKTTEESKINLSIYNDFIKTVLDSNKFEDILLKAAKDCFIGKRVACLVNFNEEDGITITFLPSIQFLFETKLGNPNVLTSFICWIVAKESIDNNEKRIFKKKFTLEDDGFAYIEEIMYDGAGNEVEVITEKQATKLNFIPAVIIINDGLSGEVLGESEIELLMDYEMWYSKLANADSDAERKSMNPTKYVVDMNNNSTKNLSTAAGAFWDLGSDQNLDDKHVMVGLLEPQMSYSDALKTSLERIKSSGYEQVDIPNITTETMSGVITSGKALKAIYWPLIVRCKEKMKVWGPALSSMVKIIINGGIIYPNCIVKYTDDVLSPVAYEVSVTQNTPLPEDELEEKTANLAEVEANVMSKKSYMKLWYGLTDDEVNEELYQIAFERQILDDAAFGMNNGYNGDNNFMNKTVDDFTMAGVNSIVPDGTNKMSDTKNAMQEQTGDVSDIVSSFDGGSMMSMMSQRKGATLGATQTSSLIKIVAQYKAGNLTLSQAVSIMMSMGLDESFARRLLEEKA